MARQKISINPSAKLFEAYMDFSGGMNSETSNERLRDNEFPQLDNVDLASRGSARRRTGRRLIASVPGKAQGVFFYYRSGQPEPDLIFAVSGRLYVIENGTTSPKEIKFRDGFTFQTERQIDAVQYGPDLFIATGTKLCELTYHDDPHWLSETEYVVGDKVRVEDRIYECQTAGTSGTVAPSHTEGLAVDGTVVWRYYSLVWDAKVVTPYTPSVMEAIYIGTNALADNPDLYIQDGIGELEAVGIKPEKRTGTVNEDTLMVAYINRPETLDPANVEYKWEYKRSAETNWTVGKDWTKGPDGKTWTFHPDTSNYYDIRVTIRESGKETPTPQYALTNYTVNPVENKTANTSRPSDMIHSCNQIRLHWDRLILFGDTKYGYQAYISDLNAPRYFPVANTISFDTGKQEPITAIVRYRDMLIIFTKTTIQTLVGKSPEDYKRGLIHDGLGCIAPRSAAVVGNHVAFLSAEGVHLLKPNQFILEVMNVSRIDYPIKSEIPEDPMACALSYDSQFRICFPSRKTIYRLYYENGMWVRDRSNKLNFVQMIHYGNDVYELSEDGGLYKQDPTIYTDDGEIYQMVVESKYLDLSASFNQKKLKRLYVLARHFKQNVGIEVTVKADTAFALNPESGKAVVENGYVVWKTATEPNMRFYTGTVVGSWILGKTPLGEVEISVQKAAVRGKCRRVKVIFRHAENSPCELFGFGLEFKEKKP